MLVLKLSHVSKKRPLVDANHKDHGKLQIMERTQLAWCQLMTARERDRSLRVGRWDLLAENRV